MTEFPAIKSSVMSVAILFICSTAIVADVPRLIHYQGKLVTTSGSIVTGPVELRIRLYDHPTNTTPALFDETHSAVSLNRGMFSVLIGSIAAGGVPDSVVAGSTVYLGASVDGAAELAPRIRIATAPYAAKSKSAEGLVRPNTVDPAVTVAADGRLGIGSTSPEASAKVDISSITQGFLPPRMNTGQRDAIASPAAGLLVFNTDTACIDMWIGTVWKQACFDCAFTPPATGNNGPLCEGSTLELTATSIPGATYSWTGPDGFTSTEQNPSIANATPAASGPYSVTATVNGCTSNPAITLATVKPIPASPTVGNDGPACPGDTLTLTATAVPGAMYNWTGPNGFTSSAQNPTIPNVTAAASGTYTLTISVNGCEAAPAQTTVTVNPAPPATPGPISGPTDACPGASGLTYSIAAVPNADSYAWSVPPGAIITAGQNTTSITVTLASSSGTIIVNASNVCGSSADRTLTVTAACPVSCSAILAGAPGAADGTYTIDPDGPGGIAQFDCYCDMTTDGGGWALILKSTATSTFHFAADYWATANTLNPGDLNTNDGNSKYDAFNSLPFDAIRGCVNTATSNCVSHTFGSARSSALSLFSGLELAEGVNQSEFETAFGSSYPTACSLGFNVVNYYGGARWGIAADIDNVGCNACGSLNSIEGSMGFGATSYSGYGGQHGMGYGAYAGQPCSPNTPAQKKAWLWVR